MDGGVEEVTVNRPSVGGCRVFDEKTMFNHEPRESGEGVVFCVKCKKTLSLSLRRAGRID
jgi:hypothetical protein